MASPVAASCAGLLKSFNPDWDNETQSEKDTSIDIDTFNNHNGLKLLLCGGVEYRLNVFEKIKDY